MVVQRETVHTTPDLMVGASRKIVLLAKPGNSQTGVGRYVHMLESTYRQAAMDVTRLAPTVPALPNRFFELAAHLGIDIRTFLANYPVWASYPQADVLHLTSQNLATLLLFHRPPGRVVVTVHDIIPYMLRNDRYLGVYRTIADRLFDRLAMAGLKRANWLIADSQYTKRCIVEQLGIEPEKIDVVYLGIDHERFRPLPAPLAIRERYNLPAGPRYLIYVGSEDPRKNLVTLVHALAELRRDLPNVELIKVGRAHFRAERLKLRELAASLGVLSAIHFLDEVPEDDLPLLYNLADVCVMPSLYEGFGLPVLEAMACGTPVVAANATSLPELIGAAGQLFDLGPDEIKSLTISLQRILADADMREALRARGLAHAATFDWSHTRRQTLASYDATARQYAGAIAQTFHNHIVERSIDLLLDPRLPHAAPYTLWRRWRYAGSAAAPQLAQPLRVCLTFDIEHDYRHPGSAASSVRFLERYLELAQRRSWRSTLFVQGDLLPQLEDALHQAEGEHEIGLHGLHHEVWGRSRWWQYRLGFVGLSRQQKCERLQQALGLFQQAGLRPPRSFRAPYLNADRETLGLLARHGFTSDSSPATFLGALPLPRWREGICQIPVTVTPRPEWNGRSAHYPDLTLGSMLRMPTAQLLETIALAIRLQLQRSTPLGPHVVLLAHPWEFEETLGVPHASVTNWEYIYELVDLLASAYPLTFATMSELIGGR